MNTQETNRPKPKRMYAPLLFVLAVWTYTLAYIFELYMRYSQ